jgi:hypothetical protein
VLDTHVAAWQASSSLHTEGSNYTNFKLVSSLVTGQLELVFTANTTGLLFQTMDLHEAANTMMLERAAPRMCHDVGEGED